MPRIVQEGINDDQVSTLVIAGVGLGFLPESFSARRGELLLKPLKGIQLESTLDVVWLSDTRTPILDCLLDSLSKVCATTQQ